MCVVIVKEGRAASGGGHAPKRRKGGIVDVIRRVGLQSREKFLDPLPCMFLLGEKLSVVHRVNVACVRSF